MARSYEYRKRCGNLKRRRRMDVLPDAGQDRPQRRSSDPLRVVVVASRPPVRALFAEMARGGRDAVSVVVAALDPRAVAGAAQALAAADVAVVDASVDHSETVAACEAIREECPRLPISAVFCCPHSAGAADLRALVAAGVGGLLDLQLSAEETLRVLRGIARGQGAFHLQMAGGSGTSLFDLLARDRGADELSEPDLALLRLVALGLTDHEIGSRLYLSQHTVKHRIDRLRRRVQARNRIQLAAWAGSREALLAKDGRAPGATTRWVAHTAGAPASSPGDSIAPVRPLRGQDRR
jgi:DNA-binding NarL/FixJ family response regulator